MVEWRARLVQSFDELLHVEIPESDSLSTIRRLVHDFRMEADPNGYSAAQMVIDRVRRAPTCFAMEYMTELWTSERSYGVLLTVNYDGLHVYQYGKELQLMASYTFTSGLISWVCLNDMLTVHVVHTTPIADDDKTKGEKSEGGENGEGSKKKGRASFAEPSGPREAKKSMKLHFLTREAKQIVPLLSRYADEVLKEQRKIDAERANRVRAQRLSVAVRGSVRFSVVGSLGLDA